MFESRIHKTADGSNTLFVPELNESYHSAKGAYRESVHVFINLGLQKVANNKNINILEVGFGTGLNCLLSFIEAEKQSLRVFYDAIEPFPLDWDLVSKLNYSSMITYPGTEKLLEAFHQADLGKWIKLNELFKLRKIFSKIEDVLLPAKNYDLVYYDAFGPKAQPEMWKTEIFNKIFQSMKPGGVFVTYCAKGQVRRDLEITGFTVERLPGPPGKREVLRGVRA